MKSPKFFSANTVPLRLKNEKGNDLKGLQIKIPAGAIKKNMDWFSILKLLK
jgi:hypothetical protein